MFEDNLPPGVRGSDIDARVESEEECLINELMGNLEEARAELAQEKERLTDDQV